MPPEGQTVIFSPAEFSQGTPEASALLRALYLALLADSEGNLYQNGWEADGTDQSSALSQAAGLLRNHLREWKRGNGNRLPDWQMVDRSFRDGQQAKEGGRDDVGWLRLSQESELVEFVLMHQVYELAQASARDGRTTQQFYDEAVKILEESRLFNSLQQLKVYRGVDPQTGVQRQKDVGKHVKEVVLQIEDGPELSDWLLQSRDETQSPAYLSADERRGDQRFVALLHDIFNIVLADNDWLNFHAHGAAAFLYRFFVLQVGKTHEEAARIIRVVSLHHVLETIIYDNEHKEWNRVLTPEEVIQGLAAMPDGWEIFGRLIRFCLIDVGEKLNFKSQHVQAILAMVNQLVSTVESSMGKMIDENIVAVALEAVTLAADFSGQLENAVKADERLSVLEQVHAYISETLNKLVQKLNELGVILRQSPALTFPALQSMAG